MRVYVTIIASGYFVIQPRTPVLTASPVIAARLEAKVSAERPRSLCDAAIRNVHFWAEIRAIFVKSAKYGLNSASEFRTIHSVATTVVTKNEQE